MLARCVPFCSYLCKVCSRVSEALLLALRTLSLSFPTNNSSSDSKAFLHFHCVLRLPNSSTPCFPFLRCEGMASHKLTFTCTTVLHCAHTFLRRIDLLHSIACTTVLHCEHTSDSHKRSTENTIPRAPSHVITHYRYVHVTERYTETLHVKKMADLVSVSYKLTLLTFELNSFRENGFLVLLHFPHCSR